MKKIKNKELESEEYVIENSPFVERTRVRAKFSLQEIQNSSSDIVLARKRAFQSDEYIKFILNNEINLAAYYRISNLAKTLLQYIVQNCLEYNTPVFTLDIKDFMILIKFKTDNKVYEAIKQREAELLSEGKQATFNTYHFWTNQIWLCDRGTMMGYDDLVVDMRSLVQMREQENRPVMIVQDATHSLQQPNRAGNTLGQRYLIPTIARSAIATGVDGLFMEVHDNPHRALSDAATQWPLHHLKSLLTELLAIHEVTRGRETYYVSQNY